jgi:16S rRNA (uracil1498-N3)-methyltransferase
MPLFFLNRENIHGEVAHFSPEESKHIRRVYRLKPGDSLMAFDEEGSRYILSLIDETSKQVIARIEEVIQLGEVDRVGIHLGVGIPKGDRFDYILQKSTELGVGEIIPFISSRTVARIPPEKRAMKVTRWERIVREAVKQCGAPHAPRVRKILSLKDALSQYLQCPLKIILYEETFEFTLKKVLSDNPVPPEIAILIGPEGGFPRSEVELAGEVGFIPAGLGRNILRVETAAIAALAMVQYHYENL